MVLFSFFAKISFISTITLMTYSPDHHRRLFYPCAIFQIVPNCELQNWIIFFLSDSDNGSLDLRTSLHHPIKFSTHGGNPLKANDLHQVPHAKIRFVNSLMPSLHFHSSMQCQFNELNLRVKGTIGAGPHINHNQVLQNLRNALLPISGRQR